METIRKNSLSPFIPQSPEQVQRMVENMMADLAELDVREDVWALEVCSNFSIEMLEGFDHSLKSSAVLSELLGKGAWSTWPWTVGQVMSGVTSRQRMRLLLKELGGDEALKVYGELGELGQKLKPFRPSCR
jgi:hypothetical protein